MAPALKTIVDDAEAVSVAAADVVVRTAIDAIAARGRFTLALSGGSTPKALYERLASDIRVDAAAWSSVHVYFGDERCVPPDHRDSNYRMAREALLAQVAIPAAQVHRMETEREPADAAAAYEATLRATLATGDGMPVLDLVLLGLGADGHTASLFPGTTLLDERHRWAVAGWVPTVQAWRVSLTLPVLAAGRLLLGLAAGADKAPAVARLFEPNPQAPIPARAVGDAATHVAWIVDRAAAGATGSS